MTQPKRRTTGTAMRQEEIHGDASARIQHDRREPGDAPAGIHDSPSEPYSAASYRPAPAPRPGKPLRLATHSTFGSLRPPRPAASPRPGLSSLTIPKTHASHSRGSRAGHGARTVQSGGEPLSTSALALPLEASWLPWLAPRDSHPPVVYLSSRVLLRVPYLLPAPRPLVPPPLHSATYTDPGGIPACHPPPARVIPRLAPAASSNSHPRHVVARGCVPL